jgi:hypothetical protein
MKRLAFALVRSGQGRGRTADLPLLRIRDHHVRLATEVSLPAPRHAMYADRPRYTGVYETRNETGRAPLAASCGLLVMPGKGNRCGWQLASDQVGD